MENSIWEQTVQGREGAVRNGAREVTEARPRGLVALNQERGFYSQCHGKPLEGLTDLCLYRGEWDG